MAKNKDGHRDYSLDINDPIRIERRIALAHFMGLEKLERELWLQLQEVKENEQTS